MFGILFLLWDAVLNGAASLYSLPFVVYAAFAEVEEFVDEVVEGVVCVVSFLDFVGFHVS